MQDIIMGNQDIITDTQEFNGQKLKEMRVKYGMTQKELGEALGIKKASISRWERDSADISIPYQKLFIFYFERLEKR